ncbi:MAG: MFS transporter [Pseudomonadota bacterium]
MNQRNFQNIFFISLSQFGMSFSFNFVMVFIPFFIQKMSPYSHSETLVWLGLIMGAPSFAAAFMSTFWGSLASRYSPKTIFLRGLLSHAVLIFSMAYVSSLPLLFALRVIQGLFGGISTVGLILVSSSSSHDRVSRDIGFFQNAMTFGQLIGPPIGAVVAAALGYRGAFISASALVFVTLGFCFFHVAEVHHEGKERRAFGRHMVDKRTFIGWGLCFTATAQLMFLPSIFPNVFQWYNIGHGVALKWAGLIVMFYTCTAMIGNYVLCRQASRIGIGRLIISAGAAAVILQWLLAFSPGIISFTAVRMLQTAMLAAIVPVVFSIFASDLDGRVIGFLNSGRFLGNALGPMIGTSILAFSSLRWVFLAMGGLGLAALLSFAFFSDNMEQEVRSKTNDG